MASTAGKITALIIFLLLISFIGLRMTPLAFTPFGFFSSTISSVQNGWENALHSTNIMPLKFFRFIPTTIISFVLLIIWIFVIVWVYRDAERRGMNGILWGLLVFIGNIIGLLIYLIVRSDNQPSQSDPPIIHTKCPECSIPVTDKYAFCPHCGASMSGPVCPDCSRTVEKEWKACPYCGKTLK
ncbi:MAG: zinc ribbon domain-containing protein [Candidatus Aminicenantes bacterium]|nr:zinc ribbon domain-containing protein [Candidatus Aminicenantes bacterium]